ncbi:FAD-dependent oxidoreductase [Desulfosoma caldarium]|uniref:4Fe-4S dicluster protein n=1 Tax=Desulfosoma caldarium TaxID=610254 RepID=A0A3N1UW20_9BACT|nr:FAD-dependent oxidoreductase [Desulfosoma caldarium]ROQ93619.1 4Fe-4S dicluster protein [Desulfosoma caldarium]
MTLRDLTGKERQAAQKAGAQFRWPCFTKAITDRGVELTTGEILEADTVIVAIGDQPDLEFLPKTVQTERGFIKVDDAYQTSDPQIFAIGDAVRLGLLTDAIGAGRKAAQAIDDLFHGRRPKQALRPMMDPRRVKLEYFDPRRLAFDSLDQCAGECASCGSCRDCGVCVAICPQAAISRVSGQNGDFEMVVNPERCIGCGFCAGACPCGIWNLVENDPLE